MITRIDVATVGVADQDVIADFFVDKLGFTKTTDEEMWPGSRWVEVAPPEGRTALTILKAADFERQPDPVYPVTFSCDDLQSTAAALREGGVEVSDPVSEPWGSYFQVTDPEGRMFLINDKKPR